MRRCSYAVVNILNNGAPVHALSFLVKLITLLIKSKHSIIRHTPGLTAVLTCLFKLMVLSRARSCHIAVTYVLMRRELSSWRCENILSKLAKFTFVRSWEAAKHQIFCKWCVCIISHIHYQVRSDADVSAILPQKQGILC